MTIHVSLREWRRAVASAVLRMRAARAGSLSDLGQAAIVAVLAVSLIIGIVGATLVATVVQSGPLQQMAAVAVYAHRAVQAGENAYVTAINANPSLAQCNTSTNKTGLCSGINYGEWNLVSGSDSSDSQAEWYAFGNPQPTFDPTTHALTNLSVQVVGAAHAPTAPNHYVFDSETINMAARNGFLTNVWWSNFESYNGTGSYTGCTYNWETSPTKYNINNDNAGCPEQVYFGPNDYLFGPVYTNDSVFVSGDGSQSGSPSFGNPASGVASPITTADPNCLFVDSNNGMNGSPSNCASANGDVHLYDTVNSSKGNAVEPPPQTNAQLGVVAAQNGCLYSGPTQITLTANGDMSVVSPDTSEQTVTVDGNVISQPTANIATNGNNCPADGTPVPLPSNGVVFVQNASTQAGSYPCPVSSGSTVVQSCMVTGANPLEDDVNNSVTNLTSAPASGGKVTLTATVTSANSQIAAGATMAFSQTTQTTTYGHTTTSTAVIPACANISNWSAPVSVGSYEQSSATCTTTPASNETGFSATYSGGTYVSSSQANLGQTYTLNSSTLTPGPNSQTNGGGCASCYYGETGTPNAEGDAFVNGSLSGQLTIGTANNIVIDGNISYADCSGHWTTGQSGEANSFCPYFTGSTNDSLGLIADEFVEINHPVANPGGPVLASCAGTPGVLCDPSTSGSGISIDAAILALNESFVVNNYGVGSTEGPLDVYGSIQQYARGPVGTFSGNSSVSGYQKHYTWNPLLDFASPPSYLVPSTAPWDLTSVNANGGEHITTVCPALSGPYNGPPPANPGVIGEYCSDPVTGLPGYPSTTAPSPPTSVYATANVGGTATVSWTDPSDNGSSITNYTVIPSPACPTCSTLNVPGANATSTSITGLIPGTSYIFTVTATNANGTSDPSAPSASITAPSTPYAPTQVTAVGNVNQSVTVSWTVPASSGSPITGYQVTPSPACSGCAGLVVSGASTSSATITGLTVGASYTFTVSATNALGTGPASLPSNSVIVPTTPGAPTGVFGTSFANSQSVVSWTAPASTGGLPISTYNVTSSPGNKTCSTSTVSCTVTGLTDGTSYTFTVTATNALGTGPASAASPAATPSTTPGAPTIGTATSGNGSATVNFTAPAANGGAPVTGYTVTSTPGGITASCGSSPCVVTGLTNGTSYTFRVVATNGAGSGPSSSASNSVTLRAHRRASPPHPSPTASPSCRGPHRPTTAARRSPATP